MKICIVRHSSETTGARDGNRTHDPSLTKTVRYRCATRAGIQVGSEGFEPPKFSQLIYSQFHLTALVTAQAQASSTGFIKRNVTPLYLSPVQFALVLMYTQAIGEARKPVTFATLKEYIHASTP